MTESGGRLSDRQLQQVRDWFRQKGVEPHCSQCGRREMTVSGRAAVLRVTQAGTIEQDEATGTATGTDLLPVICDYCAHIEWFLPNQMGVDV